MQIIADDTRAYIQNEEDDAIESTGMPYNFEKLVKMASRYERQHNKLPDENIQTIFDTSSQSSIPRGKKKQREFIEQVVQEVLQRLVQHNIKINLQKCFFGSKEVSYLGSLGNITTYLCCSNQGTKVSSALATATIFW